MSIIKDFTWEQFWDTQKQYNDMMCNIEDRVLEIAKELGESYKPHQLTDIYFEHDSYNEYVVAEFRKDAENEDAEEFEYFKVNAKWLFSDDYKHEIDEKEAERKRREAKEYQEYLRLKAKFAER